MRLENNLFYYGPSELSQDALICYLLSFAIPKYGILNKELEKCALDLLRLMCKEQIGNNDEVVVNEIRTQYLKIDVLVTINNKFNIIIEDKTFSSQHSQQMQRYADLLKEKEPDKEIILVYYKIIEQPFPELNAVNISRIDILNILKKYYVTCKDKIIQDYVDYLIWIDNDVRSFMVEPINNWSGHAYKGFFTNLIKEKTVNLENDYGWGYVSNPKGGFNGFWWYFLEGSLLEHNASAETSIDKIYLQIENNIITFKIKKSEALGENGFEFIKYKRDKLFDYFNRYIEELKKTPFKIGAYMTVGYLEYNENNYLEKIIELEQVMSQIENGEFYLMTC